MLASGGHRQCLSEQSLLQTDRFSIKYCWMEGPGSHMHEAGIILCAILQTLDYVWQHRRGMAHSQGKGGQPAENQYVPLNGVQSTKVNLVGSVDLCQNSFVMHLMLKYILSTRLTRRMLLFFCSLELLFWADFSLARWMCQMSSQGRDTQHCLKCDTLTDLATGLVGKAIILTCRNLFLTSA